MTTKLKIIIGFLLMVSIIGIVALIGYRDLQGTSDDFVEFRRISNFNARTSDLVASLNDFEGFIYKFLDGRKTEAIAAGKKAFDNGMKQLLESESLVKLQSRKDSLRAIHTKMEELERLSQRIQAGTRDAYEQYANGVQPGARDLGEALLGIVDQAATINNSSALVVLSRALEKLALVRSGVSRFAESRSGDDSKKAMNYGLELGEAIKKIEPTLTTENGKKLYAAAWAANARLTDAFVIMQNKFAAVENDLRLMRDGLTSIGSTAEALSNEVDQDALRLGDSLLAATASAQASMATFGGGGFMLGLILTGFIVVGLGRVLAELGRFGGAISSGDFTSQVKVTEKGEIGLVIDGMKKIAATLEAVIAQANKLADDISSGRLRNRLDAAAFPGSFSNLALGINTVGDSYTGILDALTLPIIASDKSNSPIFRNKAAQSQLGSGFTRKNLDGSADHSLGSNAMSRNNGVSGEAALTVGGKRMEVAVAAFPLSSLKKEVVGYIEIFTDLTEIKDRQSAVMRAIADASNVSDRVAAASEELSAQMEQISRGAEVQRSRVESTASAMTEMNSTVLEVARNAAQASEQSENTKSKAADGANLVNRVVQSINTVNSVASTLQSNMKELGDQAESIGGVMNVISDIADQTNLLALNAAIEAARAGEAGRGFAVVADEVRKLAEKTMQATQEVGANITAIQHSARVNIEEVELAAKSVNDATSLANSSGTALKEIVDLASGNSALVTSIATAAEEQSATSEEINLAIEEINRVVGETSSSMVQSSAAVQELSRMAQELRRIMEALR